MKASLSKPLGIIAMTTALVTSALIADERSTTPATKTNQAETAFTVGPELTKIPLEEISRAYEGKTPPEAIRMYLAIMRGSRMGAGEGWFGPAQSRYDWTWLAKLHGVDAGERVGGIEAADFRGTASAFDRLDRNRDGKITEEDLDWSERNPWVQQSYMVNRLFRKIDPNGDGQLTREEWLKFFDEMSKGSDRVTPERLRDVWLEGISSNFLPGDAPTTETLLQGLFEGEVGSLQEGPQVGDLAPDFALETNDGQQTIRLSDKIGPRPVVLVFGNFTCGPFRSMYPGVEDVRRRMGDKAEFLAVYVREAHPIDGWKMQSNAKVGVAVAQPKTYAERVSVAQQCSRLLNPTIPLLVDGIDDPTGNAYSGMPARLYVIDTAGRVAYKSGRGPFGFKTGEMEQALLMTLLDAKSNVSASGTNALVGPKSASDENPVSSRKAP